MSSPILVNTPVKFFVNKLRVSLNAPIKGGDHDLAADFQRNNIWSDELRCRFIEEMFVFGQNLYPLDYNTVKTPILHYEAMNGKQRSLALWELVKNNMVFQNTFVCEDEDMSQIFKEINGMRFTEWPLKHQEHFLNLDIQIYNYTLDPNMRSQFIESVNSF